MLVYLIRERAGVCSPHFLLFARLHFRSFAEPALASKEGAKCGRVSRAFFSFVVGNDDGPLHSCRPPLCCRSFAASPIAILIANHYRVAIPFLTGVLVGNESRGVRAKRISRCSSPSQAIATFGYPRNPLFISCEVYRSRCPNCLCYPPRRRSMLEYDCRSKTPDTYR